MKVSSLAAGLLAMYRGSPAILRRLTLVAVFGLGLILAGRAMRSHPVLRSQTVPALPYAQLEDGETTSGESDTIQETDRDFKDLAAELNARKERRPEDGPQSRFGSAVTRTGISPLIEHQAEIAIATKEFARSRVSLEEILERHHGYAAKLRMLGQKNGSLLSATLRVPTTELSGTVTDLKTLGEVEREEQAADEVTQAHADLETRLINAQNTLRRLQELLKKQTYPDGNVRELQRQIANASAEVSRLEAERQSAEHKVLFANVRFSLREEVNTPAETLSGQLSAAAKEGFADAAASLSALLVLLIGRGPVVVLWALILGVPARFAWRKWQARPAEARAAAAAPIA